MSIWPVELNLTLKAKSSWPIYLNMIAKHRQRSRKDLILMMVWVNTWITYFSYVKILSEMYRILITLKTFKLLRMIVLSLSLYITEAPIAPHIMRSIKWLEIVTRSRMLRESLKYLCFSRMIRNINIASEIQLSTKSSRLCKFL